MLECMREASIPDRKSQRGRILKLLIDAHYDWVPLPEILALGIAQCSARICELRRLHFNIENCTEQVNGEIHSWFRLTPRAGMPAIVQPSDAEPGRLFPDDATLPHKDLG